MWIMLISGRRPYNFQNNFLPAGQSKNIPADNLYTTANKYGRNLVKNNLFGGICNPTGGGAADFQSATGLQPRSARDRMGARRASVAQQTPFSVLLDYKICASRIQCQACLSIVETQPNLSKSSRTRTGRSPHATTLQFWLTGTTGVSCKKTNALNRFRAFVTKDVSRITPRGA